MSRRSEACHKAHIVWALHALNAPLCTLEAALSEGCRQQPGGDPAFPAPPGTSLCFALPHLGLGSFWKGLLTATHLLRAVPSPAAAILGALRDDEGCCGSTLRPHRVCATVPQNPWCCTFVMSHDCFVSCVSSPSCSSPLLALTAPRKKRCQLQHRVLARPPPPKPEPQTTFHFTSNDFLFFWFRFLLLQTFLSNQKEKQKGPEKNICS